MTKIETIDTDKMLWIYSVQPDRYSKKEWIIHTVDYGKYSKKEAEIIANFIRENFAKVIRALII